MNLDGRGHQKKFADANTLRSSRERWRLAGKFRFLAPDQPTGRRRSQGVQGGSTSFAARGDASTLRSGATAEDGRPTGTRRGTETAPYHLDVSFDGGSFTPLQHDPGFKYFGFHGLCCSRVLTQRRKDAEAQRGGAANKINSIRKPGSQEFFPMVLGFMASS
jgi:hypothetical protein